jgi:hypothetical protein
MALHVPFQQALTPQPDDPLLAVVLRYQEFYDSWLVETDRARRAALRDALHACQEELWPLLADPLLRVAQGWLRSGVARDMWACPTSYPNREDVLRSLAMNMYIHVIDALPQLQIDPNRNLLACLKKIATWGMFDEHQRIYHDAPRHPSSQAADQTAAPGSRAAQMWPARRRSDTHLRNGQAASESADLRSMDFEDQLTALLDQRACCQAVWAFWETLAAVDQQIVLLRWNRQPPIPYETIAQQLGPEWIAATVRQRHCRVLSRTRAHLQQLGLIDGDDAVVVRRT